METFSHEVMFDFPVSVSLFLSDSVLPDIGIPAGLSQSFLYIYIYNYIYIYIYIYMLQNALRDWLWVYSCQIVSHLRSVEKLQMSVSEPSASQCWHVYGRSIGIPASLCQPYSNIFVKKCRERLAVSLFLSDSVSPEKPVAEECQG